MLQENGRIKWGMSGVESGDVPMRASGGVQAEDQEDRRAAASARQATPTAQ